MLQYQGAAINATATLQYEKDAMADKLLWNVGTLNDQDMINIVLHVIPDKWKKDFAMIGGNHRFELSKIKDMMAVNDGFDRANRRNRYTSSSSTTRPPTRGGERHNNYYRGRGL
jgi:hypothetical protein